MNTIKIIKNNKILMLLSVLILFLIIFIIYPKKTNSACTVFQMGAFDFCVTEYSQNSAIETIKNNEIYFYTVEGELYQKRPRDLCEELNNCSLLGIDDDDGRVNFAREFLRDSRGADRCLNLPDIQLHVPYGYRDWGYRTCISFSETPGMKLYCYAMPGGENGRVTFVAKPINSTGEISYRWYSIDFNSEEKYTRSNGESTVTFNLPSYGLFRIGVDGTDSTGKNRSASCGVTLNDEEVSTEVIESTEEIEETEETVNTSEESVEESEEGPDIVLKGYGITNNVCELEWATRGMEKCFVVDEEQEILNLTNIGTQSVDPGKYIFGCVKDDVRKDVIYHDEIVSCIKNSDFREI